MTAIPHIAQWHKSSLKRSTAVSRFNVRRLGAKARRSRGAWLLLAKTLQPFDLIGIQEVMENLEGIEFLQGLLGPSYELFYSPLSGTSPGKPGARERVAFLYNRQTVRRTDIAGTLHVGSGEVIDTILSHWTELRAAVEPQLAKVREAEATGSRYRPRLKLPAALSFRRAPFMVSFELGGRNTEAPYRFLAVNCHLEFSQYMSSRWNEPELLMGLLAGESMDRRDSAMVNGNIVVLGDLNLDYNRPETDRPKVDALLESIAPRSANGAEPSLSVSFPFLGIHPDETGVFRTNTRKNQTFDQIGLLAHDSRFPGPLAHQRAGFEKGGFDYGVFDFVGLIERALSTESMAAFSPVEAKNYERELLKKLDFDVSDHLPIWIRLPMPDASGAHLPLSPSAG